jgi:2-polyprenyl-3-methyl-5-hydroxy-6-metoxy-1,4-benzoquinol methylase
MNTLASPHTKQLTPDHIMQIGMGFWASKTLLTAIKVELFTLLGGNIMHGEEIKARLELHDRGAYDFLDALVALGFLHREGIGSLAFYENTPETALFLDKQKPSYIGGILEMANDRLYKFWGDLEEALHTGKPQNEVKYTGKSVFEAIYAQPQVLQQFMQAMAGTQKGSFATLANKFPFHQYRTMCDIGGANGLLSISVAGKHPHLQITTLDLPPVEPIAAGNVRKAGLLHQIGVGSLDMMQEEFPQTDIITMGNILHDWNIEQKKFLIRKAYQALSQNGALIVIENIIDDERKTNAFGLLMSLNMLVETEGGFDYSFADFTGWATEAGFRSTEKIHLAGPASAVIAYK